MITLEPELRISKAVVKARDIMGTNKQYHADGALHAHRNPDEPGPLFGGRVAYAIR